MVDHSASLPPRTRVRDVLDRKVENGAHAELLGSFVEVVVTRHEQSGLWARGLFVDDTGAIKFWLLPRAFALTDRACLDEETAIVVNACVSISDTLTALMINEVSHVGPTNA